MLCSFHNHRFGFFTVLALTSFLTIACGTGGGTASDPLVVVLQIPEGESPEYFWYGVERRVLEIERGAVTRKQVEWSGGASASVEVDANDILEFRGYDVHGGLLVEGRAMVTKEKKASIPLRRVL